MLRYKTTLLLSNEPSHDYVGLTGPELNVVPVGIRHYGYWPYAVYCYIYTYSFFLNELRYCNIVYITKIASVMM